MRGGRRRWRTLGLVVALVAVFALGVVAAEPLRVLLTRVSNGGPTVEPPSRPPVREPAPRALGTPVAPPPGVDPEATDTRFEDFSSDPDWEAERNRSLPPGCPSVRQDFGFAPADRSAGASDEVGGRVFRTHQTAYYAKPLPRPLTLEDRFSFEGSFDVERLSEAGSNGVLFGLFNHAAHDWRTPQSMAIRVFDSRGASGKVSVAAEYGTREYRTDQLVVSTGTGIENPEADDVVRFDPGRPRRFRLDYDPAAAGGRGRITLAVGGVPRPVVLDLLPGHRRDGAVLDRFGMLNQQHEVSGSMDAYFGDLRLNGVPVAAEREPVWEGRGNRRAFRDCEVETFHNFGFGEASAAAGGLVWRTDFEEELSAWYGDGDGLSLDLDEELYASGRVRLAWANSDSGVYLGWFGKDSKPIEEAGPMHVPTNLVAMLVEGPSEVGWYARPVYGTDDEDDFGFVEGGPGTPTIHPAGWHEFTIHYDPEAGEHGEIAVTLDGRESRLAVSEDAREANADLDHFGIRTVEDDGHAMMAVFDDLTYTRDGGG